MEDNEKNKENKENKEIKKIEEICFAGAGQRGICYVGVIKALEELKQLDKKHLKKVVGSSIGSFIAACYLSGYTIDEMFDLTFETDIAEFKDITLKNNYSLFKGIVFNNWVIRSLEKKISKDTTFADLYEQTGINFCVVAVCLDEEFKGHTIFNHENTPNVKLCDALIASMSIPLVFPPQKIGDKYYVDSVVVDAYPLELISEDGFGVKTISKQDFSYNNVVSYLFRIINIMHEWLTIMNKEKEKRKNQIIVDTSDFNRLDFDITPDEKITLFQRGYDTAIEFFDKVDIKL